MQRLQNCAYRLREDLKMTERDNHALDSEIASLKSAIAAKDRALARNAADSESAGEKLAHLEGVSLITFVRALACMIAYIAHES